MQQGEQNGTTISTGQAAYGMENRQQPDSDSMLRQVTQMQQQLEVLRQQLLQGAGMQTGGISPANVMSNPEGAMSTYGGGANPSGAVPNGLTQSSGMPSLQGGGSFPSGSQVNGGAGQREAFIAVRKNGDGDLREFMTSSGRVLSYEQALQEVQMGRIQGANVFKGRDGDLYIRGDADGDPSNNLDNLPGF
ncbi:Uncharacterised protein [Chlamydia abortus]|nr:Uncharacterised protein [Chlamydia abortus]